MINRRKLREALERLEAIAAEMEADAAIIAAGDAVLRAEAATETREGQDEEGPGWQA